MVQFLATLCSVWGACKLPLRPPALVTAGMLVLVLVFRLVVDWCCPYHPAGRCAAAVCWYMVRIYPDFL